MAARSGLGRAPDLEESVDHQRREQRGDDVGQRHRDEVGGGELREAEDGTAEQRRRPGLPYPSPPSMMKTSASGTNTASTRRLAAHCRADLVDRQ
jgi:hypothetical protein